MEEAPDPLWFECPSCDRFVTGLVLGTGPSNTDLMSRTHCCLQCQRGEGHDALWCCGVPKDFLREAELPYVGDDGATTTLRAHYVLHEPDWDRVKAPVPALLFLHGALTYIWPESLYLEVQGITDANAAARDFVIIAPLAAPGEALAVVSDRRTHGDRFGKEIPYVERFEETVLWDCFLAACDALGPGRVDFCRLCASGYSMGAQAAWDLGITRGSMLAAIVPMAGRCLWPEDSWEQIQPVFQELRELPVRAFSIESDAHSYELKDFCWLAEARGLDPEPCTAVIPIDVAPAEYGGASASKEAVQTEVVLHAWGELAQLELIRGHRDNHNCWDLVYRVDRIFGLFRWMAEQRNPRGASLALTAEQPEELREGAAIRLVGE